jgi:O-antigen ligase
MNKSMTPPSRWLVALLFCFGIGGSLLSSDILAGATLLIAIGGMVIGYRKALYANGWDKPKELRLLHFAFWFFVLISTASWALEGFSYEGGKTLGAHARFILLWPLLLALTYARIGATTVFTSTALLSASTVILLAAAMISDNSSLGQMLTGRFGGGINPISFGNIALLGGMITLTGGIYFLHTRRQPAGFLLLFLGIASVFVAMLSQTRSNLVALPVFLLLLIPLFGKRLRIVAAVVIPVILAGALVSNDRVVSSIRNLMQHNNPDSGISIRFEVWGQAWQMFSENPLTGAGLGGYSRGIEAAVASGQAPEVLLQCCTGHAHSDFFNVAATSGIPGILSWALLLLIPLTLFGRHLFSTHKPSAHLAVTGTMISAGYFLFGLTEATFNRTLFLTFYLLSISGVAAALFQELGASYTGRRSVKVSATIITKNEEHHIADCLQSARLVADEIIVLDSGSTDRTVEIAKQYADIVEVTDWPGFGVQKQRALEKATGDWVLSLDADERISPELGREINHRLAAPDADAYKLPWAVTIYGTRLDFGRSGRAPLRLFRREGVRFSDALVHERILIPKGRKTRTLCGRLTHYTHRDFGHSLEKSAKYAWLGSLEKHRRGKKTRTMIYPTLRGILTFIQVYFVRFGFLDGAVGYLTAVTYAQVTFNKYVGLWTLSRKDSLLKNKQL